MRSYKYIQRFYATKPVYLLIPQYVSLYQQNCNAPNWDYAFKGNQFSPTNTVEEITCDYKSPNFYIIKIL